MDTQLCSPPIETPVDSGSTLSPPQPPVNSQAAPPFLKAEPIPGYSIHERIGMGGYGEVWKAQAPGGLWKALKFVYGTLDEARASRELKSLNRVKEAHHPFLLSLERIEIVDGYLIIVTELADRSLKDRFNECRETGLPGIPRDELLRYLRDTADALDFLCHRHGLQHLDVKPENLLLLGNHVKVADFGLLKDLSDNTASMMGGLTPTYSPPELFDGHPNKYSDQYSLAIVFCEMLTGERPFAGRTAGQLAAQHLHSRPDLSALAFADRAIIERALSKRPERRFASCSELVEKLAQASNGEADSPASVSLADSTTDVEHTEVLAESVATDDSSCQSTRDIRELTGKVKTLPPIDLKGEAPAYRPVIFVGIGGTGGRIVRHVYQQMHARVGNLDHVPSFQFLAIDVDVQAINLLVSGDVNHALPPRDTLTIPLRCAAEYRRESQQLLRWMSRRWLFNIPRSLQTNGLRPLGRLAFVDHFEAIEKRLLAAIQSATSADSLRRSSEAVRAPFAEASPLVFVVSSLSGGTGSGCLLDMAFAIRKLLGDQHPKAQVLGLLTHSSNGDPATQDLAAANAYACLDEMRHFSSFGGSYPGEEACRLPACDGRQAFDAAYLIPLGEELTTGEFDEATERMADYLVRNAVGSTRVFFRAARQAAGADQSPGIPLRTFGFARWSEVPHRAENRTVNPVCQEIIRQWLGTPGSPRVRAAISSLIEKANWNLDSLVEQSLMQVNQPDRAGNDTWSQRYATQIAALAGEYFRKSWLTLNLTLADIQQALLLLESHFANLESQAATLADRLGKQSQLLRESEAVAGDSNLQKRSQQTDAILHSHQEVAKLAQLVRQSLAKQANVWKDVNREFVDLANSFEDTASANGAAIETNLQSVAVDIARQCAAEGTPLDSIDKNPQVRSRLLALLRKSASEMMPADEGRHAESLAHCFQRIRPRLLETGGAARLLAVAPKNADPRTIKKHIAEAARLEATIMFDNTADWIVCLEAEQLSFQGICAQLVDERPEVVRMAQRLRTRIDVEWS